MSATTVTATTHLSDRAQQLVEQLAHGHTLHAAINYFAHAPAKFVFCCVAPDGAHRYPLSAGLVHELLDNGLVARCWAEPGWAGRHWESARWTLTERGRAMVEGAGDGTEGGGV
jgi:hypothetical protein